MVEPTSAIGPVIAIFRWLSDIKNKSKIHIQRKTNDDNFVFFYVVFKPAFAGQTLWARVSIKRRRDRVFVFWPDGGVYSLGIPWGVQGDGDKFCYCRLISKPQALAEIANGTDSYRLTNDDQYEAVAWSRYGDEEIRAGFAVKLQAPPKRLLEFIKLDLVNIEIIDENAKQVAARTCRVSKL